MKIAYIFQDVAVASGIRKKVQRQSAAWAALGHEVRLFVYATEADLAQSPLAREAGVPVECFTYRDVMRRGEGLAKVERALRAWQPDLVYTRWTFVYPALVRIMRRFPTVVEVIGAELEELKRRSRVLYYYARLTNLIVGRLGAGFVHGNPELVQMSASWRKGPATVVSNGIDLDQFELFPAPQNPSPVTVFLSSSDAPWHGLDEILRCAEALPHWRFEMIGLEAPEGAPANTVWHGRLERAQYDPILAQADVAWAPLSLFRKGQSIADALKTREYMAHGIPIIIGGGDPDLTEGMPCVLHLPNSEGNVMQNLERVVAFVEAMQGQRVPRESIAHFASQVKEQRRVEFLESVMAGRKRKSTAQ